MAEMTEAEALAILAKEKERKEKAAAAYKRWREQRAAERAELAETAPIRGNRAIQRAAVEFVIKSELAQGRSALDTSNGGAAGDVQSEGRVIEVKACGGFDLRARRLLYFTPPQLREGERNPDYYVYIVENVAQGDPLKFELRILHGEQLRRLFAAAKPHRFYVAVHAAEYEQLDLG